MVQLARLLPRSRKFFWVDTAGIITEGLHGNDGKTKGHTVGDGLVERHDLALVDQPADCETDNRFGGRHSLNRPALLAKVPVGDELTVLDDNHRVRALGLCPCLQPPQCRDVDAELGRVGDEENAGLTPRVLCPRRSLRGAGQRRDRDHEPK